MTEQKEKEKVAPKKNHEGLTKRNIPKPKKKVQTPSKQSNGKLSQKRECRYPSPDRISENKWLWKILVPIFALVIAAAIYVNFFSSTQEEPPEVISSTESLVEKLASKISSCPEGMEEKCNAYWYDVDFLRQNPSQAILVINAGGVTQSQCFGTFVDFSPFNITALFTAAHCHSATSKVKIVEIIYYDQESNNVAFKSIEDFIAIEHPLLKLQQNKSSLQSNVYAAYNFDITLLLSTEMLAVKAAKLPNKGQKLTGTYITPYFKDNYNQVKMVDVKLIDSIICEKNYKDKNETIKNFQEVHLKGGKKKHREIQICVDRKSEFVARGHSGSSLLVWDEDDFYFLGSYSKGPGFNQKVPHLYVAPGSLEEIIQTFNSTSNWHNLVITARKYT